MKSKYSEVILVVLLVCVLVLSAACSAPGAAPVEEPAAPGNDTTVSEPADTDTRPAGEANSGEEAAQDTKSADTEDLQAVEDENSLAPEPQQIPFLAADGHEQEGTYFPGARNPGPAVILMHWAGGNQSDWAAIAPWLQNRGIPAPESTDPEKPWLDSSWFPALGEQNSFGVFTFTFRNCEEGCMEFDREGWLNDAHGAMEIVRLLPGVDPEQILILGASIGADGAADACLDGCLGALSLSPGDYLGMAYSDVVRAADAEGKPMWCLASEEDTISRTACSSAEGDLFRSILHPGSNHGMRLILPETFDPDTMEVILEFLDLTIGLQ